MTTKQQPLRVESSQYQDAAAKPSRAPVSTPCVMLVSGGIGRTAQHLFAASRVQFPNHEITVNERSGVKTVRKAKAVANEAAKLGAVVFHTLVDPKTRHALDAQALARGIPFVDMLGPTLSALGDHLRLVPHKATEEVTDQIIEMMPRRR